ncbi:ester cyclase [Amycolatopsis taiwanensis]|uniref:ester cyclase n=1 Tax=Amycolatopsis taiwanensis TaxID=342230 RepID=UPI0004BB383C|nr:ester cyclase [Amycolatopsis taiwanensis]
MLEQTKAATSVAGAAEVHRRVVELFSAGRREEALALIDPDVVDHRGGTSGDHKGVAAWKQKWEYLDDSVRSTIEHNVASGDFSVNRYTVRGTHPASGRSYEVTGIDMVRVWEGKIVEHWALVDSPAIGHQLGVCENA